MVSHSAQPLWRHSGVCCLIEDAAHVFIAFGQNDCILSSFLLTVGDVGCFLQDVEAFWHFLIVHLRRTRDPQTPGGARGGLRRRASHQAALQKQARCSAPSVYE